MEVCSTVVCTQVVYNYTKFKICEMVQVDGISVKDKELTKNKLIPEFQMNNTNLR